MAGFCTLHQQVVPVLYHGHLLQRLAVRLKQTGVVKGDPEPSIALNQRGINVAPVLLGEAPLLQGVPHGQPGHFFRQQGVPPDLSAVGIGAEPANLHQADAVRRGRAQLDELAAHGLTEGAVLVPLLRHDADDLPSLFPQALGDALEHGGLARAAGAEGGEIAVP